MSTLHGPLARLILTDVDCSSYSLASALVTCRMGVITTGACCTRRKSRAHHNQFINLNRPSIPLVDSAYENISLHVAVFSTWDLERISL